jgi:hypothetical protein
MDAPFSYKQLITPRESPMKRLALCAGILLLLGACAAEDYSPRMAGSKQSDSVASRQPASEPPRSSQTDDKVFTAKLERDQTPAANEAADEADAATVERKIVYHATLSLVVGDLVKTKEKIDTLVQSSGGYLAQFQEQRIYGDRRSGHWVVRVPSPKFQAFVEDVVDLGVSESQQIEAEEITEQYYDLEQRLKNARRVEQEMLEMMEKHSGKMADVLEATKNLGEVRGETELLDGRLRRMAHDVAMSTVTIDAREDENYIPPQAPTFAASITSTFGKSLETMQQCGKGLVLLAVALSPWLVLLLVMATPLLLLVAIIRRRKLSAV